MKTEKDKEGEGRKKTIPGLFARKILRKTDDASGGKRECQRRRCPPKSPSHNQSCLRAGRLESVPVTITCLPLPSFLPRR